MIQAQDLIAKFVQARDERWGYILGKSGQTWTEKQQAAATDEMAVKYGSKWIGRKVADCSGLFYWAFKQLGGSIYHGSNSIWSKYLTERGKVEPGMELKPGTALFLTRGTDRYHIGLYIGNDTVIEAKSTYYGVVTSKVSHWHEWGLLKGVDYTEEAGSTVRMGDRGEAVKKLQNELIILGYDCGKAGADGIFGKGTLAAVKAFQSKNGLEATGVADEATIAALEKGAMQTTPKDELTDKEKLEVLWAAYQNSLPEAVG